jgi:hypothetical protein
MKALFLLLLLSSCCFDDHRATICKIVAEIGGCNTDYCGVKFTDETFTAYAERPVIGAVMCKVRDGNQWILEEKKWK